MADTVGPDKIVAAEPSVGPDDELTDEEREFLDFLADTAVGKLKERLARGESPDLDFDSRASSSGSNDE